MLKKINWTVVGIFIIVLLEIVIWRSQTNPVVTNSNNTTKIVDSLNTEINILKTTNDSLLNSVDSSENKLITIDNYYEKKFIDITNQSIANDVLFFTNYISKVDSGFISSNNSGAIKNN